MHKQGFSLMEILIAMIILMIAVGGVLLVFPTEKKAVTIANRKLIALSYANEVTEELKNAVGADTWPNAGDLGAVVGVPNTRLLPAGKLRDIFGGTRTYTVVENVDADPGFDSDGNGDPTDDIDYKKVEITVDWNEP